MKTRIIFFIICLTALNACTDSDNIITTNIEKQSSVFAENKVILQQLKHISLQEECLLLSSFTKPFCNQTLIKRKTASKNNELKTKN